MNSCKHFLSGHVARLPLRVSSLLAMNFAHRLQFIATGRRHVTRASGASIVLLGLGLLLTSLVGCGMAASPQPPSLNLPQPIKNLAVQRTGNQVSLHWDTPRENTDHLKLGKTVRLRICRRQQHTASWITLTVISAVPGQPAEYIDALPDSLLTGPLRPLQYSIFGVNQHDRTAGASNVVAVLAGPAPPQVQNLSLQVVPQGVLLRWQAVSNLPPGTSIRIERTLIQSRDQDNHVASTERATRNLTLLNPAEEPAQQTLQVNLSSLAGSAGQVESVDTGTALDSTAMFGRRYRYAVSRIVQRTVDNRTLAVAGSPSTAVEIMTRDTFPPATPTGLAAIAVSGFMNHGTPEVDLSWAANTEPDFARYRIERQDRTNGQRMQQMAPIETAKSIIAPAFRDLHVQAGHTYAYAVSAIDTSGNESPLSQPVLVKVPER